MLRIVICTALAALLMGAWSTAAQAQDIELYILDTHTGVANPVTDIAVGDPYNASFSNNGKKLVHEIVVFVPGTFELISHDLAITDPETGETTLLGEEGDNAVWSPNGNYIAYGYWMDEQAPLSVKVMPAEGGAPSVVREWALEPSWSNNSRRLAFADISWWQDHWGYIGTVDMEGNETRLGEDWIGAYGCNPDYSPDGKLIVYENWQCIWEPWVPWELMVIPVDEHGEALGMPYPVTSGEYYAQHPSFSNDGKTIVFSGDPDWDGDFDIYTVSVYGGDPVLLYGVQGAGEWDAAYSNNGRYVVFSSHSVD